MDTIFWLSASIEPCNWINLISVAYASWYLWSCGRTQRKAATINQFACPSYSLHVQLLWYPMYYPGGMKALVSHVQWSKPHRILAPVRIRTRAAGFRIISGDHYTTPAHCRQTNIQTVGRSDGQTLWTNKTNHSTIQLHLQSKSWQCRRFYIVSTSFSSMFTNHIFFEQTDVRADGRTDRQTRWTNKTDCTTL